MAGTKIMLYADHDDPSMRAESLVGAAFNCTGKYCDPFDLATADLFNMAFDEQSEQFGRAKAAIATSVGLLAFRFSENSEIVGRLKTIYEEVVSANRADELFSAVDKSIGVAKELGM
ncbi:MAG: hypothetical protein AAF741_06220 [Bacteroidota bacterium]